MPIVIGDTHFDKNNLNDYRPFFSFLKQKIRDTKTRQLIFLGDIYNTKAIIRSEAQNFFISVLNELTTEFKGLQIVILVGNHDFENLDCTDSALGPLKLIQNVAVIDKPSRINNSLFVPYVHDKTKFLEICKSEIEADPNLDHVYCHQGIHGFDYGNGIVDTEGVLAEELPSKVKFVVGHYHKFQERGNVCYLGTPKSHSYGEANQDKFIAEVSAGGMELISTDFIMPKHYKIKYIKEIDKFDINLEKINENDFVEVLVICKKEDIKDLDRDFILAKFPKQPGSFRLKFSFIDNTEEIRISENIPVESMLKEYLDSKNIKHVFDRALKVLQDASL